MNASTATPALAGWPRSVAKLAWSPSARMASVLGLVTAPFIALRLVVAAVQLVG